MTDEFGIFCLDVTVNKASFGVFKINLSRMGFWERLKTLCTDPPKYKLTTDLILTTRFGVIIVPAGFITDFASIPRVFWSIPGFSPSGPLAVAAILHDFAYQHGYLLTDKESFLSGFCPHSKLDYDIQKIYPEFKSVFACRGRDFFDDMLRGLTVCLTGAKVVANVAHCALNMFGGVAWAQYRAEGPGAHGFNYLGLPGVDPGGKCLAVEGR